MANAKDNFRRRYSNTGLGQTPSVSELGGLMLPMRKRAKHYEKIRAGLKKKAEAGDELALARLKRLFLSAHGHQGTKQKPTKVRLAFLEKEIPE